jgi:hypothetical protein
VAIKKRKHCPSCERPFRNEQAVRAHLRFCDAYRLSQINAGKGSNMPKAAALPLSDRPENPIASPSIQVNTVKPPNRRTGRQSQESLLILLNVDELFPNIKAETHDRADIARVLSSVASNFIGLEDEWNKVYEALDDVHRDYEQMVFGMRLDSALLFSIYQRMLGIKEQWLSIRTRELSPKDDLEMSQESYDALREEKECWTAIIYKLKQMLVASR